MPCVRRVLPPVLALTLSLPALAAGLGGDWQPVSGTWGLERELLPMIRQGSPAGCSHIG